MKPLVALESTIITHGMPYPENLQTSKAVEEIIKQEGAIPATIAVINGEIKVGLTDEERQILVQSSPIKLSTKDLPIAIAKKLTGGTTVAATMHIAKAAGIDVFVTGGIGGVHRGVEETFDISADLHELSRTDVVVVSAGAKTILDIPKTLEVLETYGVPIIGYRCNDFPAFLTVSSDLPVHHRIDSVQEIVAILAAKRSLGLKNGLLVTQPVPKKDSIDPDKLIELIVAALNKAEDLDIRGKEISPFLLNNLLVATNGQTLRTNISLIKNNARLGAQIAKAINPLS